MACNQYRNLLKSVLQVQARHISLQSCMLARGSRFVLPESGFVKTNKSEDAKSIPGNTFEADDYAVISLEEHETKGIPKISMKADIKQKTFTAETFGSVSPNYTRLGDKDKKFSSVMTLMRSRKERERRREILLEGHRLIQDALDAGVTPRSLFFSRKESLEALKLPPKCPAEIFKLPYKQMQLWSNLTTSPGIMGVFETPEEPFLDNLSGTIDAFPLTLVCDNVREPGNLGAILRVAAGVGCLQVILTKGCVELWEPKVLRSGAGSHFRIPVHQKVPWEDLENLVQLEKATVFLADNRGCEDQSLPARSYNEVGYSLVPGAMVLVLGGETQGLSQQARQLAEHAPEHCRLHVPLAGGVESLNAGAALAVIMFEIRRQRMQNLNDSNIKEPQMIIQ